jgi:hypothetical protein
MAAGGAYASAPLAGGGVTTRWHPRESRCGIHREQPGCLDHGTEAESRRPHTVEASFYADDAELMAEDTEPIHGRAAIEQFWRTAIARARAANARRTISLRKVNSSPAAVLADGFTRERPRRRGGWSRH